MRFSPSFSLSLLLHESAALTQHLSCYRLFFSPFLPDLLHILSDHTQPQLNAIWHPGCATTDLETPVNKEQPQIIHALRARRHRGISIVFPMTAFIPTTWAQPGRARLMFNVVKRIQDRFEKRSFPDSWLFYFWVFLIRLLQVEKYQTGSFLGGMALPHPDRNKFCWCQCKDADGRCIFQPKWINHDRFTGLHPQVCNQLSHIQQSGCRCNLGYGCVDLL